MSSLEFNPSGSLKIFETQLLKPKMLVSPCNHMLETDDVIKIISSSSLKKECTHCQTEIKEYRTIDMADFAVKVKNEISKVEEFVSKKSIEFNSKLESFQSKQQEFETQLTQKDGTISQLKEKASTSESKFQELESSYKTLNSQVSQKDQEIQSNTYKIQELQSGNEQLLSTQSKNQSEIESLKQQLLEMTKKMESLQQEKANSNVPNQESKQEVESEQEVQNQQEQQAPSAYLQVKLNYKLPEGYQLGYRGAPDWNRTRAAEFFQDAHHFYSLNLKSPFKFVLLKNYNDFIEWEELSGDRIVNDPQEIPNFQPIFPSLKK